MAAGGFSFGWVAGVIAGVGAAAESGTGNVEVDVGSATMPVVRRDLEHGLLNCSVLACYQKHPVCQDHLGFEPPKSWYIRQGKTMLRTYAAVRRAGGSAPSICSKHGFHPPAPVAPGGISANN